jgi:phosphatidylserine decarboxylase
LSELGEVLKMSESNDIKFYNRSTKNIEIEKVYGDKAVKFVYNHPVGKLISGLASRSPLSKFYGYLQDSYLSRKKVRPFIKNFNIPIDQYLPGSVKADDARDSYKSFNEFFVRGLRPGARTFVSDGQMPAPADARYVGFESINDQEVYPVKGEFLRAKDLIGKSKYASEFENGPLFIARLCPVDYHRYHYPDAGSTLESYTINGKFYSVSPIALSAMPEIFIKNERRVSILETQQFGKLAYIEVGATMVGKIVQSFDEDSSYKRGDQKGYFLFGASTVIIVGEKGKWKPSLDIIENTKNNMETYIKLGDEAAIAI